MKLKNLLMLAAVALAGVAIAVCLLSFLGSKALFSNSQAAPQNPLIDPPVTFLTGPWPPYASEALSADPYPPRPGEPTRLCAELENHSATQIFTPTVEFRLASGFGIGLNLHLVSTREVAVPPGGRSLSCIYWVPPTGGDFVFEARLSLSGYEDQHALRALDVDEPLQPGVPHSRVFVVINQRPNQATIQLQLVPHQLWRFSLSQVVLNLQPGGTGLVTLTVTPTLDFPAYEAPVVDVEARIGGDLYGGFRKIYRPPVSLHHPPDPAYAENEISITPYPPRPGEPTQICATLENSAIITLTAEVRFSWAPFGIGLPFNPMTNWRPVSLPPRSQVQTCITWVPPAGGLFCVQAELAQGTLPVQRSQRNIDVGEPLEPLTPHPRQFVVVNASSQPVTYTLGMIPHLPDWGLQLSEDVLRNIQPGGQHLVTLTVIPPAVLPPEGAPIVDIEAYHGDELVGGFRKIFQPPVPVHQPQDPVYAESEIQVNPYPPRTGEPVEIAVELRNPTPYDQDLSVQFGAAPFGIGLPFTPLNQPMTVTIPANGLVRPSILWVAPQGGLWCFQVEVRLSGHEAIHSQKNIDVGEPLEPLVPHARQFLVVNSTNQSLTYTLALVPHLPGWSLQLSQDVLPNIQPYGERLVTLTVTPPTVLPPDGAPVVDVEAYHDGELVGGFRKIYRPPVPIHRPGDPVYAESEIGVDPYPVLTGQPVHLSVQVFNPTDADQVVTARFEWASFGIGLPLTTTGIAPNPFPIFVPAHGAAIGYTIWTPPPAFHGLFCVRVWLQVEGHEPIWSQRNIDVGEPLEPGQGHRLEFPVRADGYDHPVTVTLGLVSHLPGWQMSVNPPQAILNVGQEIVASLVVTPPLGARLGTGAPIADVEAYVEGELLGGFRKLDVPPVALHKPHEKVYAESEILVEPYPPQVGRTSWVSTTLQNSSNLPMTVDVAFGWAQFGMGIPFSPVGMQPMTRSVLLDPGQARVVGVRWTPSLSGHQCVLVRLQDHEKRYEPQQSQRNVEVAERTTCGQHTYLFTLNNPLPMPITVTIGSSAFNLPPGWSYTIDPAGPFVLSSNQKIVVTLTVFIPCPTLAQALLQQAIQALQQLAGSLPTINVEGVMEGELLGGIQVQFAGPVELPKIYLPYIIR